MVFEKIREIICDKFAVDEDQVTMNTSFKGDLNADSLDMVEIVGDAVNFISNVL